MPERSSLRCGYRFGRQCQILLPKMLVGSLWVLLDGIVRMQVSVRSKASLSIWHCLPLPPLRSHEKLAEQISVSIKETCGRDKLSSVSPLFVKTCVRCWGFV